MSETYEIRLRNEFGWLRKLENDPFNANHIVTIYYKDRFGNSGWKSIKENPSTQLYPYQFKVTYKMPMYVGRNDLKRDWQASILFDTPEDILMNPNSEMGVTIDGNGGNFPDGSVPFNRHVSKGWICTGSAWGVANQGFGIWYFVISLGALFNQDKFMMAEDEGSHLNGDAYRFWRDTRGKQPNNPIKWPFKLTDRTIVIGKRVQPPQLKSGMKIGTTIR